MGRPRSYFEAHLAEAVAAGGWEHVGPPEVPDLGGLVLWPEMPWNHPAAGLEVDELRTAMLAEPDVDVPVRCSTGIYDNVRSGTPYQRVDGLARYHVWPTTFTSFGWRAPLPDPVHRFGDPTGWRTDSQHISIDVAATTLHELSAMGVGWHGRWQARRHVASDYSLPFERSRSITAGGIPLLCGLVRPEEIAAGRIRKAMLLSGPASPRWRWPARGSDGLHPDHPLEYGDRLVLRPDVAADLLDRLEDPGSRTVVECLRDYGAYHNDRTYLERDRPAALRTTMAAGVDFDVPGLRYSSFLIVKTDPGRTT